MHSRAGSSHVSHVENNSQKSDPMYKSQINRTIKVNKDSIKDLQKNNPKHLSVQNRTSRGKLRKRCSEILDLPYLPQD